MQIQIQPKVFLVSALKRNDSSGFSVHPATNTLIAKTQIPINGMQGVVALRPYLKLEMTGGTESVVSVIRFQTIKDGRVIHTTALDRRFWGELILQPVDVPDLSPYRARDRMLGNWNVSVDIGFFAKKQYQLFAPPDFKGIKQALRFQHLLDFKFEVVSNETSIELTATGRLTVDRDEIRTTYTLDDL